MSRQELRVYISGGPNRQRFSNKLSQCALAANIESDFPWVNVVKGGKTDYIIIDDENTSGPSATALATGGETITYSDFYELMHKQNKPKPAKKSSVRKHSNKNFRAHAEDMEVQKSFEAMHMNETEDRRASFKSETKTHDIVVLFAKYAVDIQLLIAEPKNKRTHVMIERTISQIVDLLARQQEDQTIKENMNAKWLRYAKAIVAVQASIAKGKCTTALDAQQQLKMISNDIIVLFIKSETNVRGMMDFFAMHDRHAVQMILDRDDDESSQQQNETMTFDAFLELCLEFAMKWRQENTNRN